MNYYYMLSNDAEERSSHLVRGVSLESHIKTNVSGNTTKKDINCHSVAESVILAYLCYNTKQKEID